MSALGKCYITLDITLFKNSFSAEKIVSDFIVLNIILTGGVNICLSWCVSLLNPECVLCLCVCVIQTRVPTKNHIMLGWPH